MKKIIIDNSDYSNIIVDFDFAGNTYEGCVNYAYFNSKLDEIFRKHDFPFSEEDMLYDNMIASNYRKFVDNIVERAYSLNYNITYTQDLLYDVVVLFNHMVNLFDQGNVISLDISIMGIAESILKDKKLYDLVMTEHCNDKMTPEQIRDKRDWLADEIMNSYIPSLTPLLKSGFGIKVDQLINIMFGLHMRVKANSDLNEIYPRYLPERWLDGLQSLDSHFIESNIQRLSGILNHQVMQSSGAHNKDASIIAQDTEIVEMDCGSINYMTYFIEDKKDLESLRFKYRLLEDGSLKEITLEDTDLIGTNVKVRSVLKCACTNGVCATCYGSNAKWNLSTDKYRFDVGFVSARDLNSGRSQKILSVKHSSTPKLVDASWDITDMMSGELITIKGTDESNDYFDREFNKLIIKPMYRVTFDVADVLKGKRKKSKAGDLGYIKNSDAEFGEYDIIRVKRLYLHNGDDIKILEGNSYFRVKGFPRDVSSVWEDTDTIEVANPQDDISYVIKNTESIMEFSKLRYIYGLDTKKLLDKARLEYSREDIRDGKVPYLEDQLGYMYELIKPIIKGDPISIYECALRNKIRAEDESRIVPDWTTENPGYYIESAQKTIKEKPTLSAILPKGYIYARLTNDKFHDVSNLSYSVFDLLFQKEGNDD